MQATVERALTRAHQFDESTRLDSWMYRIAQNLHIDRMRSLRRRGTNVDVEHAAELTGDDGRNITEARSDLAAAQHAPDGTLLHPRVHRVNEVLVAKGACVFPAQDALQRLQSLPEDQRATFLLVVVEGLSYREAADVMAVQIGTVMSRIARARLRIAEELARTGHTGQRETAQ